MSDNDMATGSQAQVNGGMSQADVDFLMCCLRNTTGGSIQVDTQRVAQLLNYKNPRSVSNKVSTIKKKYDLPFGASSRTAEEMATMKPGKGDTSPKGDNEPSVPTTPSKNRVTKTKAAPKPRVKKAPAKKSVKKVVSEDEEEEEEASTDVKDEDMEDTKQEEDDE